MVAADAPCNGAKSDFLAASRHLERWHRRADTQRHPIAQLAEEHTWTASDRVLAQPSA